jgi:hypothetical protein
MAGDDTDGIRVCAAIEPSGVNPILGATEVDIFFLAKEKESYPVLILSHDRFKPTN